MSKTYTIHDFDYDCPEAVIARYPADKRDESKLMVLDKSQQSIEHKQFKDIVDEFNESDVLIVNNSKVFPCRLFTTRTTGGKQEFLLLQFLESKNSNTQIWQAMMNASKKVKLGDTFNWPGLQLTVLEPEGNVRRVELTFETDLMSTLDQLAEIPLPPYMQRKQEQLDKERYQTIYAKEVGSVAAPTAGLHFTDEILNKLKAKGVHTLNVTLHVGPGTFLPVKTNSIEEHKMHTEFYHLSEETVEAIHKAKNQGKRITAVGTTTTRCLEAAATKNWPLKAGEGQTDIFIYPPYKFKVIDQLITNFHLPKSTLMMLVSAFYNRDCIMEAYEQALNNNYRFFSYGDAMFIKSRHKPS